jgi:hypothetical protein
VSHHDWVFGHRVSISFIISSARRAGFNDEASRELLSSIKFQIQLTPELRHK